MQLDACIIAATRKVVAQTNRGTTSFRRRRYKCQQLIRCIISLYFDTRMYISARVPLHAPHLSQHSARGQKERSRVIIILFGRGNS